jgi:hypothetical protein
MKNILLISTLALFFFSNNYDCLSQKDSTRKFCNPSLEGMARSKGFSILYERALDAKITSTSEDTSIGNSSATIGRNNKFDFKLKIPVWNRPGFKVVIGFKYYFEEFNFNSPEGLSYPLYQNLEDKNLKSIGGNINILKPLNETKYLGFRLNGDLNGDYNAKEFGKSSFLKYSIAAIYGWKKCETKTVGIGIYHSYTFGKRSFYPVLAYANTYSKHWGIEALLPASFKVRHNVTEKTLFYAGYEVEGSAYHLRIDNPPLSQYKSLELRRSNIRFTIDFEQEIYDFLWFGITAGLRQPISLNLSKEASARNEDLITNKLALAPFFNASIFIVPPRTLENKILYNR